MIEEKSNSAIVLPKRGNQNPPSPLPSPARGEGIIVQKFHKAKGKKYS
jgi:hypothetical protein